MKYYSLRTISMCALMLAAGLCQSTFSQPIVQDDVNLEAVAADAAAVIRTKHTTPLDKYILLVCGPKEQASLSKDSDAGAFVRYMTKLKSTIAVLAMPTEMADGPAYCVYFNGRTPLGIVPFTASQTKTIKDEMVEKAYGAVSATLPPATEKRPVLTKTQVAADDGSPVPAFQIVGWK
jgi:hypothetical protein